MVEIIVAALFPFALLLGVLGVAALEPEADTTPPRPDAEPRPATRAAPRT
jgi:hypothetical protein